MADVEETGRLAGPEMLGHDAFILDGHVIARERNHPPAARAVPRVQRQRLDDLLTLGGVFYIQVGCVTHGAGLRQRVSARDACLLPDPIPLCHGT